MSSKNTSIQANRLKAMEKEAYANYRENIVAPITHKKIPIAMSKEET